MKGRRSGQETYTNAMKSSSSSSSHSRRMTCKCGEEVLLLKSSTKTNPGKTFGGAQIGRSGVQNSKIKEKVDGGKSC
ncbi:hypothetical protein SESBI_25844 [Sesbania bispinosa]|nr:hypothetical protein SESBI_25844 [Sesbania bispinosa]